MSAKGTVFARILFILYLAVVAYLCFGQFSDMPKVQRSYFGIDTDKIVHFIMFFPFAILGYFAVGHKFRRKWTSVLFIFALFIIGCIIAGASELGQSLTTYRVCDPADFKADALALALSSLITLIIIIFQHQKC